jgi:hypothetical protein
MTPSAGASPPSSRRSSNRNNNHADLASLGRARPAFITVVLVVFSALTTPSANASAFGVLEFSCTTTLSAFPSLSTTATCRGRATGAITGRTTAGQSYTVTAINDRVTLTFLYSDICASGTIPLSGFGNGTMKVQGVSTLSGTQVVTVTMGISWSRFAFVALTGSVSQVLIDFGNRLAKGVGGDFEGLFIPRGTVAPNPQPLPVQILGEIAFSG